MKKLIKSTKNVNSFDRINEVSALSIQRVTEPITNICKIWIEEDANKDTGEPITVGLFADMNGKVYCTVSEIIINQLDTIMGDIDNGTVSCFDAEVVKKTSLAGREYYVLQISSGKVE